MTSDVRARFTCEDITRCRDILSGAGFNMIAVPSGVVGISELFPKFILEVLQQLTTLCNGV